MAPVTVPTAMPTVRELTVLLLWTGWSREPEFWTPALLPWIPPASLELEGRGALVAEGLGAAELALGLGRNRQFRG